MEGRNVTIFNVYNPCKAIINEDFKFLHGMTGMIIICGDFNSHNKLWGSKSTDANGRAVEDVLDEHNLVLLNDGSSTRLDPSSLNESVIDLTLSTSNLAVNCEWQVTGDYLGSDHYLIQLCVCQLPKKAEPNLKPVSWAYKKANWEKYKTLCKACINLSLFDFDVHIDIINNNIIKNISSCADSAIPVSLCHSKCPSQWCNQDCDESVKARNAALSKVKRTCNPVDFVNYKRLRAIARKTINTAKRKS
jgi:hypothetical protein